MKVKLTDTPKGKELSFFCPACNGTHTVSIDHKNSSGSEWHFNGNFDEPTLMPSILSRVGPWDTGPEKGQITVCHSFVRDGLISYLSDCTHKHAGQTLAIPDVL